MKEVLLVLEPVNQSNILLLDDVVTTGASVREATCCFIAAGVHSGAGALARVW